jgi:Tol biopolymer transport system component/predicted Ser/Thr protein kinase
MLSHYRLVEPIGEGGMGIVWKAHDEVLNRLVAIKLLAADASRDESHRKMFLEEARLASSVSHAHIVQVYEFVRAGNLDFIVMEYIDGRPLSRVMRGQPLPPRQVADYGRQVALAVARAHRQGLLHRDLKPGNILLTPDGEVKVVDFGLAILFERRDMTFDVQATGLSEATTQVPLRPEERRIAGTLPYMSPEQLRGERLDSRSDIFSFGVILYEMTTGSLPFRGATVAMVAAEIQKAQPTPVHEIIAQVPFELDRTIQKALAARPSERYQTMDDMAVDLNRLSRDLESGSSPAYAQVARRPSLRLRRGLWSAAGLLAAALLVTAMIFRPLERRDAISAPVHRQVTFTGAARNAEISPDGQFVAYIQRREGGGDGLMVQDLAGGQPLEILQAKRLQDYQGPRWSPGGAELLVCSDEGLLRLPRLGGSHREVVRGSCPFVSWSPDGKRVAAAAIIHRPIRLVDIETEQITQLPLEKEFTFLQGIDWSPEGNFIAFYTVDEQGQSTIWTIPSAGGAQEKILTETAGIKAMRWSGEGRSLYYLLPGVNTPELRRIDVDPKTGRAASGAATVLTGLPLSSISFSRTGNKLAYTRATIERNLWLVTPGKSGRAGSVETRRLTSGTFDDQWPVVSPDGSAIAFVRNGDLNVVAVAGGPARQLTFTKGSEWCPAWSPDGRWIAFGSNEGGTAKVWRIAAEGGTPRAFDKTRLSKQLIWAPGARILYQRPGNRTFHLLEPETGKETPLVDESAGVIFNPLYAPDGTRVVAQWLRYSGGGKRGSSYWAISLTGSPEVFLGPDAPVPLGWSADGTWLYTSDATSERTRFLRMPAGGGKAETVFEWPFGEEASGFCSPFSSDARWLCGVGSARSDVWLVEHLDPNAG